MNLVKLMLAVTFLLNVSSVNAQDIDTQLLNLKNEAAARKTAVQWSVIKIADWRTGMHTLAELQGLRNQLVELDRFDLPTSISHGWITVSVGSTTVTGMFDEWGIDPDSSMAQMMIMTYGNQQIARESVIARRERLWWKGCVLGGQTANLDDQLVQIEASRQTYKYGLSLLDPNDSNYASYSMMYNCMIEYCEDALFEGYAKSYADWGKAYEYLWQSKSAMDSVDIWYWRLIEIRDAQ